MTSLNCITGGEYMHELRSASACAFELVVGHGEASENAPKRGLAQGQAAWEGRVTREPRVFSYCSLSPNMHHDM